MSVKLIGNPCIQVDECISTNTLLAELDQLENLPTGTVILTRFQTNGKGQMNRVWASNKDENILMSILLRYEDFDVDQIFYINKAYSLAIKETLQHFCKTSKVLIKWPNDIIINHKKVGGILIENTVKSAKVSKSIVGIGLNINQVLFENLPDASSLKIMEKQTFITDEILQVLYEKISHYFELISQKKIPIIEESYHQSLYMNGDENIFSLNSSIVNSKTISVNQNGKLMLIINDETKYFSNGEIKQLLKPF